MSMKGNFPHNKYGCNGGETLSDTSLIKLVDHDYQNNSHIILSDSTSENIEYINSIQDGFQQSEILCSFVCDAGLGSDDLPLENSSLEVESIPDSDSHIKFPDSPASSFSCKIESFSAIEGLVQGLDEQIDNYLLTDFHKVNKSPSEDGTNSMEEEQRNVSETISAIAKTFGLEDLLPETFQIDGKLLHDHYNDESKILSDAVTSDSGCENESDNISQLSLGDFEKCSMLNSPTSLELSEQLTEPNFELVNGLELLGSPPLNSTKSTKNVSVKYPLQASESNLLCKDNFSIISASPLVTKEGIGQNVSFIPVIKAEDTGDKFKSCCAVEASKLIAAQQPTFEITEEFITDIPIVSITDIEEKGTDPHCSNAGTVLITRDKASKKMQIVLTLEQGQQIYDIETESGDASEEPLDRNIHNSLPEEVFPDDGQYSPGETTCISPEDLLEYSAEIESERSNDFIEDEDTSFLPANFVQLVSDIPHPVTKGRKGKTWVCPVDGCGQLLDKECKLRVHMLSHKGGSRPFKCEFEGCDWAFTTPYRLRRHAETHLGSKDFICDFEGCNRKFTTVYNLKTHIKRHKWPNSLICPSKDCNMSFANRRKLELHLRVHEDVEAPYKCNLCDKQYYSANCIASHLRTHQYNEDDFKCPFQGCGKVYDKICRLRQHIRHHTGDRPYTCPADGCKWSFMSASKLTRHMRKHTGERKFTCTEPGCGKSFMRPEHLKGHIVIHSGDKPFHCPHENCDARFTAKSSLYVHVKKHCSSMLKVVYPCPIESCIKKYNGKATLKQHLQKFHPVEYESKELNIAEKLELTMPVSLVNDNENSNGYMEFEEAIADDPETDLSFQFSSVNPQIISDNSINASKCNKKSKTVPKSKKKKNLLTGYSPSSSTPSKLSDKLSKVNSSGCARTDFCCTPSTLKGIEQPLSFVSLNTNSIDTHDARSFMSSTEIRSDLMLASSIIFHDQNSEPLMKSNFLHDDCPPSTHSLYHDDSILVSGSFESELIPSSLLSDDVDSDDSVLNHSVVFSEQNDVDAFAESIHLLE